MTERITDKMKTITEIIDLNSDFRVSGILAASNVFFFCFLTIMAYPLHSTL